MVPPSPPRAVPRTPRLLPPSPEQEGIKEAAEPKTGGSTSLADQRLKKGLRPGQLDPDVSEVGHRQRELAGRRSYLRNFWYAAGKSAPPSL